MHYLVSAENTNYHLWQLQILIESFKKHNLLSHLTIALAVNDEPKIFPTPNIPNLYFHENIGRKTFLPMNKPYAILSLLNKLPTPCTILSPDMILVKPINANTLSFSTSDLTNKNCKNIYDEIIKQRPEANWIPLGSVMVFDAFIKEFFERVLVWMNGTKLDKESWVLTFLEYSKFLKYQSAPYEGNWLDNNNIIHYKDGFLPYFSKKMFPYKSPEFFSHGNVYNVLHECANPYVKTILKGLL